MRGRGGWRRGPPPFHGPANLIPPSGAVFACRPSPFDLALCEASFPRVLEYDDSDLAQTLVKKVQAISATAAEMAAVQSLMNKVKAEVKKIASVPDALSSVVIDEYREVGSYRKDTMLTGHNTADLVVVLKTLPTIEAVSALGQKVLEGLKANDKEVYSCANREFGCEIAGPKAVVHLLITTVPSNARLLDPDLHLKESVMIAHFAAIRHANWFDENAADTTIKNLIRVLKDIRNRFEQLQALSIWSIELISHYAVMNTATRQPLTLSQSFRRFFQLLAAGLLLPTSPALVDPCEANRRIHQSLTHEQMDQLCSAAQTLLRIICHGGYKRVLEPDPTKSDLVTEITYCDDDVVVTPLEAAYVDKVMEPMYEDELDNGERPAKTEGMDIHA